MNDSLVPCGRLSRWLFKLKNSCCSPNLRIHFRSSAAVAEINNVDGLCACYREVGALRARKCHCHLEGVYIV